MKSMTLGRSALSLGTFLAAMALMWVLLVPPQAGPDEPDHLVRAAGLARGEITGTDPPHAWAITGYELPAWVDKPRPNCYKFVPAEPASCSTSRPLPDGEAILGTRAGGYQIWGHLPPAAGTFAPKEVSITVSRILDAVIPVGAVALAAAVAARRGWLATSATLFAVTPMAWFIFAVVNPSGLVIAGGLLMWTALVSAGRAPPRLLAWMLAAGWAMMTLPRRDGLVWAMFGISLGLLVLNRGFLDTWRSLRLGPQILLAGSTLATLAWAATSDSNDSRALLLAPAIPVCAALGRRAWYSPWMDSTTRKIAFSGATVFVGALGTLFVMSLRDSGFDRGALRNAILRTGEDLLEAVGHLGWLDTPLPSTLVYAWMITLGVLASAAFVQDATRLLVGSAAVLLVAIITSWTLTMLQDQPLSTYWQGRYYLPLLVGIPVLLGTARLDDHAARRVGRFVLAVSLVTTNVALAAAVRRWADGIAGTLLPWEWDTYDTALPPILFLAVHAIASAGVWFWALRAVDGQIKESRHPMDPAASAMV